MSVRKKKTPRKPLKRAIDLPCLTDIYHHFSDAQALVAVACEFIMQNNDPGPAVSVLYLGVKALDRVADELEEAEMQFDRFVRKNAKGGAT